MRGTSTAACDLGLTYGSSRKQPLRLGHGCPWRGLTRQSTGCTAEARGDWASVQRSIRAPPASRHALEHAVMGRSKLGAKSPEIVPAGQYDDSAIEAARRRDWRRFERGPTLQARSASRVRTGLAPADAPLARTAVAVAAHGSVPYPDLAVRHGLGQRQLRKGFRYEIPACWKTQPRTVTVVVLTVQSYA
jgi:hypothetical protein